MSAQQWNTHLAHFNFYAGQLAARGDQHVALAQVQELAINYKNRLDALDQATLAHSQAGEDRWSASMSMWSGQPPPQPQLHLQLPPPSEHGMPWMPMPMMSMLDRQPMESGFCPPVPAFADMPLSPVSPALVGAATPATQQKARAPKLRGFGPQKHTFAVYTPTDPCPDKVHVSGSKLKQAKRSRLEPPSV